MIFVDDALGSSPGRSIINSLAANLRSHVDYVSRDGTTVKATLERA